MRSLSLTTAAISKRADKVTKLEAWASAVGVGVADIKGAWQELRRRGLVSVKRDKVVVSPLAMRRAASDAERSLAAHLSGYLLTENSFVVRQAGDPPGLPCILDTRITVEHIANYFREGWGVTEIERDLDLLTRAEIEAAIQYYLNHRAEIERDLGRSRDLYEKHAPKRDTVPA